MQNIMNMNNSIVFNLFFLSCTHKAVILLLFIIVNAFVTNFCQHNRFLVITSLTFIDFKSNFFD